ncbi:MAG: ribonuclease Y [Candidatus Protochlamydia sp.]|nr:ribonuclease Y [Candidatus Protochlamydia sp.]
MNENQMALYLLLFLLGSALGAISLWMYFHFALGGIKRLSAELVQRAEQEAAELSQVNEFSLKQKQMEYQRELEIQWQQERKKNQKEEERLKQREDKIENRMNLVEKKLSDIEKREAVLIGRKLRLEEEKKHISENQIQLVTVLEKASGLSSLEAKEMLLSRLTNEVKTDAANLIRRIKKEAEEEAGRQASTIIATAINRMAVSCASETAVCTVAIPNEEMKGRIIGREGRNIRALERETGINFIIDDTPGAVVLSGFDPVRKHIAKMALSELVQDGRIHPTRIEEVVEKATHNVNKQIKQYGEDAALRAGAINLHPEVISLIGKLKFRYSYGQNILDHSLEVSHLMGLMAAELGLDIRLAKRIGLLHDMGKAVTHEIEGSHAIIGHDLALKFGESKEVANGIGCHHHEMPPFTIEADLCSAADAISASREGARIEAVEEYIKRLRKLEEIALEFSGVDKAYAMQAGREIRIVVLPDLIDDAGVINLARDLTKRIEQELSYPGKIKVTVIREKRVVEYAV